MLDGLFMLLSLSTLMAIASFLAGLLPLSVSLSSSQLRLVSTIGMGVLVGTSLIVIIPEGIETLYSAYDTTHAHSRRSLQPRNLDVRWDASALHAPKLNIDLTRRSSEEIEAINAAPGPVVPGIADLSGEKIREDPPTSDAPPGEVHILDEDELSGPPKSEDESSDEKSEEKKEEEHSEEHGKDESTPHAWVGVSLILGFILMYLIDTLPSLKPQQPPQRMNIYSLSDLSASASPSASSHTPKSSFSTTLGLVIHSAADGIALGASSTQPSLSAIIFFAIIVHKAPAAFGLTSVLLKQGLSKRQARAHLVAFSLAAPSGALFTWLVVRILGGGSAGGEHMKWWTGVVLLFSGGTFLYVAMHTMQDDNDTSSGPEESLGNGYLDAREGRQKPEKSLKLIMASVLGMLLPLVTQIGHAH